MTTPAQATAAPISGVLIDGKEYTVTPLTDKAYSELDNWLRQRLINTARESLPPEVTEQERKQLMSLAFDHAMRLSWLTNPDALLRTPEGIIRFVYQLLKPVHPTLTIEQLATAITNDPPGLDRVMDAFQLLTGGPKKGARKKGGRRSTRTAGKSTAG